MRSRMTVFFLLPLFSTLIVYAAVFFFTATPGAVPTAELLVFESIDARTQHAVMLDGGTAQMRVDPLSQTPSLHLQAFGSDASLTVHIPYPVAVQPRKVDGKLVYSGDAIDSLAWWQKAIVAVTSIARAEDPRVDVSLYTHERKTVEYAVAGKTFRVVENENGAVEFDAVFHEPPVSNVVSFPFETDTLEFEYQPSLKDEPLLPGAVSCSDTVCLDADGVPVAFRPENVVGSYAVYYRDGKTGDYSALGGPNYKTGKAFHIYRPKIFDAEGRETWGELRVEHGAISVVVPQEFLDTASYPVTVDPTFGFTSIGGTSSSWTANFPRGTIFALSEEGSPTSISMYTVGGAFGTHTGSFAVYDNASTATLYGSTTSITLPTSAAWVTSNVLSPITMPAGNYRVVSNHASGSTYYVYYDTATNPNYPIQYRSSISCCTWPSLLNTWTQFAYQRVSSYVTYGSSAPDTTAPSATLTSPSSSGTATSSTATLAASASDETALGGVSFYADGTRIGSEVTSSPYSVAWDTTATSSGSKTIVAVARDTSNNYATSSAITITIDNAAPTVSVTAPDASATVSGSSVALSATASDELTSIATVNFFVNGTLQGTDDSSPYSIAWDSTATSSGAKTVLAVARDSVGNVATSSSVSITVSNALSISSITATPIAPNVTIAWTTSLAASSRVFFGPTTSYGSSTPQTDVSPRVTSHSVELAELPACVQYQYVVVSVSAFSDTATSSNNSFYTSGCTGDASVSASSVETVATASGGTVTEGALTLTVPSSYSGTTSSATFQANRIDTSAFFSDAGAPASKTAADTPVYTLRALVDATTTLDTFSSALTVSLSYTDGEIEDLSESTLWMYRYDGSAWYPLSGCVVDTAANTVSCTTSSFSDFALFGDGVVRTSGSSGATSGGGSTLQGRIANLVAIGNTAAALDLMRAYPAGQAAAASAAAKAMNSTTSASCAPYRFTRVLMKGMAGEEVRALQKYLNCSGFTIAESGPGSPGNESAVFARRTYEALKNFQTTYAADILHPLGLTEASGSFGTYSRKKVHSLLGIE